jgi:hypothetical protein
MKTSIISTPGGYRIRMADHRRQQAEALGALACRLLLTQDSHQWARAADGEFLTLVKHGAKILRTIGLHAVLDLTETEAHLVFMACRFLALQTEMLSARERRILQNLLLLLARCCRVEVGPVQVPEIRKLPLQLRLSTRAVGVYVELSRNHPISLADAAMLRSALSDGPEGFETLRRQLDEVTTGFCTALGQIGRSGTAWNGYLR